MPAESVSMRVFTWVISFPMDLFPATKKYWTLAAYILDSPELHVKLLLSENRVLIEETAYLNYPLLAKWSQRWGGV
jgi:hypothetical protein